MGITESESNSKAERMLIVFVETQMYMIGKHSIEAEAVPHKNECEADICPPDRRAYNQIFSNSLGLGCVIQASILTQPIMQKS